MHRKQLVALIVAASLSLVGCGPKKQPTKTAKPNPPSDAMTNVDTRMSELQQRAAELDAVARQLPGRDLKSDRDLVVQAFDRSSAALVLLGGPSPGGAFRQQLRIIDTVRQEIKTLSPSIADDPTIDSGLRALYNALTSVRERLFPDDPRVRYLNLGRTVDMKDTALVYDGIHLVARGNEIVAEALVPVVQDLIRNH